VGDCTVEEDCTETVRDASIGFYVIQEHWYPLLSTLEELGYHIVDSTIDGQPSFGFSQSSEGYTVSYDFLELPSESTLMIVLSYIDEEIVEQYRDVEGFLPFEQQNALYERILESVNVFQ